MTKPRRSRTSGAYFWIEWALGILIILGLGIYGIYKIITTAP